MKYTIKLVSDALPGTGFGSEMVDDYVPRGKDGKPVLPASHIKGLMRDSLTRIFQNLRLDSAGIDRVLGTSYQKNSEDGESRVRLTDALLPLSQDDKMLLVHRTAIDDYGTAKETSLRTQEAVAAGTVFEGEIFSDAPAGSFTDAAWKLGLLSIFAIGGSRNRGCGQCIVDLSELPESEKSIPTLQQRLVASQEETVPLQSEKASFDWNDAEPFVPVRLTFHADSPVCVPATVCASQTNMLQTDFTIPASAVRGMIIRKFADKGEAFQTRLFECNPFLAYPLQPCAVVGEDESPTFPFASA